MGNKAKVATALLVLTTYPVWGGAINRYACMHPIASRDAVRNASEIYFNKIQKNNTALFDNILSVKCSMPQSIADVFFGITVGSQWKIHCAYVEDGIVYSAAYFNLNRCRDTNDWEYESDLPYDFDDRSSLKKYN